MNLSNLTLVNNNHNSLIKLKKSTDNKMNLTVGFIGAGQMATALAKGFVNSDLLSSNNMFASDKTNNQINKFQTETGIKILNSNNDVISNATTIILAVKPNNIVDVLKEIAPNITKNHLIISIAAGISLSKLQQYIPNGIFIRVMPNTPAIVGSSATAFSISNNATLEHSNLTKKLFSSVGYVCQVEEYLLDAITGLSGSGPAYVSLVLEAMIDGGVACGLSRDIATQLATYTLYGTSKMILETNQEPSILRNNVTSPGGTTVEGLHELEKAGIRAAFINAIKAATEKNKILNKS